MEEENIDFQEEHLKFLNSNQETRQIMEIFSRKLDVDTKTRKEQVFF